MREYSKIYPQIWIGPTAKKIKILGLEAQLLSHYLISCPHSTMIGVYYLPLALVVHETGLPLEAASKAMQQLIEIGFCSYDEAMEYVWVHNMASYQIAIQLKPNDNRVKNIIDLYKNLPKLQFLSEFYLKYKVAFCLEKTDEKLSPVEAPSEPLLSQEQEQEQNQEQQKDIYCSVDVEKKLIEPPQSQSSQTVQAKKILDFLNEKTGKIHPATSYNLNLIKERLQGGATAKECFQVIAKKTRAWKGNEKMEGYLQPSTLFREGKFSQYVSELVVTQHGENLQ
jgi:uncharacterized phage protein (TIGR02220 family)